jgi:type III secretion system YscD/HrpQ family protein
MQRFILRVLTGPNAGAEALLGERTVVGSDESDDIMIGDGALAAGHFTIQVKVGTLILVVGDAPLTVKAEAKGKGAYQIAPFDLIKFGSTCCAIGPEGADWPAYDPSDLLPPMPAAAVPAAPPEAAESPSPPEQAAAAAETKAAPARSRRFPTRWAAAAAAIVLVVGLGVFWIEHQESDATTQASRQTAQEIVAAQAAKGVTVRADGSDGLIAEGFVVTNEQQRRLRQALQEAGLAVKYRVASLEQQVSAARTIVAASGARLAVEGDPETGKIVLDGFLPDASQVDAIVRGLRRDIAELRPLETRIVTPETVRSQVVERLRAAGLDGSTNVEVAGNVVRIRGSLPEDGRKAVARVADELNDRWQGAVKVENATTGIGLAPAPVPITGGVIVKASPPPAKFIIIVGGRDGFVRDEAGRRYAVGDKLPNGEVVEDIRVEEIITSRDGVRYRYTFGGGR